VPQTQPRQRFGLSDKVIWRMEVGTIDEERNGALMGRYTFRTGKGDEDIDTMLAAIPPSARSWYIKRALRFHDGMAGDLRALNATLQQIAAGGIAPVQPAPPPAPADDDSFDPLGAGIADILK